mgnify:CR=1 FL=1
MFWGDGLAQDESIGISTPKKMPNSVFPGWYFDDVSVIFPRFLAFSIYLGGAIFAEHLG